MQSSFCWFSHAAHIVRTILAMYKYVQMIQRKQGNEILLREFPFSCHLCYICLKTLRSATDVDSMGVKFDQNFHLTFHNEESTFLK